MGHSGACPKCGSSNVHSQVYQENTSSKTTTKTNFKFKEKKHGFFWWVFIGWWWSAIDLLLWFVLFFPRLILRIFAAPFKRHKYKGASKSVSNTRNSFRYKTVYVCNDSGKTWSVTAH